MNIVTLGTSYFLVDKKIIVEVKNENYFGAVLSTLAESNTMREFHQKLAGFRDKIPYTIYEVSDVADFNQTEE